MTKNAHHSRLVPGLFCAVLGVGEFQKQVSVAMIVELAGAGQIPALQLGRVEPHFEDVIAIQNHRAGLPSTQPASGGDVRFGPYQRFDIAAFDWVVPLRAGADVDSMSCADIAPPQADGAFDHLMVCVELFQRHDRK